MKTLLIRPPETFLGTAESHSYGLPLGIAYIGAVLKKIGYTAVIYDALSASYEEIKEKIRQEKPDVVGISNQFSSQFENAKSVADIVKDVNKNILTVVGGSHPSSCPSDFFIKTKNVDIVVIGEGEYTMLEILDKISKNQTLENTKGIVFRRGNEIVTNPKGAPIEKLDELPYPAYELLDIDKYFKLINLSLDRPAFVYPGSERTMNFITSRGCPYNCIFCSIHSVMGNIWRANSPEYVIAHIKFLIKNYKIRHIHFEDDNLTLNKVRFNKIIALMLENNLKITWDTPNGVRADILDEEILQKSKRAGCIYLIMGVESGDQYVLDNIIGKRLFLEVVERVASISKRLKLNLEAFFVIGFPGETIRNMKNTLAFAFKLQFRYGVYPILFIATPLPGTRLYNICLEKGYLEKGFSWSRISSSILSEGMIETEHFKRANIKRLFKYFKTVRAVLTIINFLRVCFSSPIFVIKKVSYLFKIFFVSSMKIKFTLKILLRNLVRYSYSNGC